MDARTVTLTEKQLRTILTALNEWETVNINNKVVASGPMKQGYETRLADITDAQAVLIHGKGTTSDINVIPVSYIARKEDFQKCLVDNSALPVVAIYSDGRTVSTNLINYIRSVSLSSSKPSCFEVVIEGGKRSFEVTLI